MIHQNLESFRNRIRDNTFSKEKDILSWLPKEPEFTEEYRHRISERGANLAEAVRTSSRPTLIEAFLTEYGLETEEGAALMCLTEAALRIPDAGTLDMLIEDKITAADWHSHLGQSSSAIVNIATLSLILVKWVLDERGEHVGAFLKSLLKGLAKPIIREAILAGTRKLGRQFILGETIEQAVRRAKTWEKRNFTCSYDMLGEAARTKADADRYAKAYNHAISVLSSHYVQADATQNPGISVKLSALHPRYERAQRKRILDELVPRLSLLAQQAKKAKLGFTVDAEEAERLDLSLDIIERTLADPTLAGWNGFGVAVQAYAPRAPYVIDWLYALAQQLNRKITVRLVKGAYWDTEIKRAQVLGLPGFPVLTRKAATDACYIICAHKLLGMGDHIYPQFATHNAHSIAAILEMASDGQAMEFQRLQGMGERLYDIITEQRGKRCRIYMPVGSNKELLAYLARRMLENGANSSFVHQTANTDIPVEKLTEDPFEKLLKTKTSDQSPAIQLPADLYGKERRNSKGWDLTDVCDLTTLNNLRETYSKMSFQAVPIITGGEIEGTERSIHNPALLSEVVGKVREATSADIDRALASAKPWVEGPEQRAETLLKAAISYEEHTGLFAALMAREAGKTLPDIIGEIRESVDFLRYYAAQIPSLGNRSAQGVFACISPWNFPLAIFTGQIAAALAAGNAVLAKPAEQTPLTAAQAVALLHEAGVPKNVLQFLPGKGETVGASLVQDARVKGVCFTGSTATAQKINRSMAANLSPSAPLIAETGGLNAMIVDSTALLEQAIPDIIASAFQSAGQRCSALRCLYVQEDIADSLLLMLFGAMDELSLGDPWELSTDIGPVIDKEAQKSIQNYLKTASATGRILKKLSTPQQGSFVSPTVIRVKGIEEIGEEIFGPVLHVATFSAGEREAVMRAINAKGYGLTFCLHTRIEKFIQTTATQMRVGNLYVNRNQVGAVVGTQPFGGEGLSGTGPKAGGPHYLARFTKGDDPAHMDNGGSFTEGKTIQNALDGLSIDSSVSSAVATEDRPGPTGELNRLSLYPKGVVLCLGPGRKIAASQAAEVRKAGSVPFCITADENGEGRLPPEALTTLTGFEAAVYWGEEEMACAYRMALAARSGPLLPLIMERGNLFRYRTERHLCVNTMASGGNRELLSQNDA